MVASTSLLNIWPMLLPRFSILWVLLLTAVAALLLTIVRQAVLGTEWAIAVTAALGLVMGTFLIYGTVFVSAYGLAKVTRTLAPPQSPENPFIAEGQFPPQQVPRVPNHDGEKF